MNISKHIIDKDASILDTLRQLNATTNFTLFVVDENRKVVGAVTDGDIRRGLIAELQ
jgi:predicted transcriptional regulator